MTVESASYISQLDAALPAAGDQKSEGDDHFRLIKSVLKTQFPNFGTTAITTTAAEVNYLSGVTSAIQTQINARASLASPAFTGVPTVPTAAPGTSTTQAASTEFVAGVAFSTALPSQTGNGGKLVTTDGTNASWAGIKTINGAPLIGSTADLLLDALYAGKGANSDITSLSAVTGIGNTASTHLQMSSAGAITIPGTLALTGATSTLGYGTGAGGTVTQATSKSTAVAIHKPCGVITTHAAALLSGGVVEFLVSNSLCSVGDGVRINQSSFGINTANYRLEVAACAASAFVVRITNLSGITLSEAIPIAFSVTKGAIS